MADTRWQKIDSAPRDGTRILYWNKYNEIGHCRWCDAANDDEISCWWDDERDDEAIPRWWASSLPRPERDSP